MVARNVRYWAPKGFTLIELVIVVGILVVLAGMMLPSLDIFKLRANKGVAATDMADGSRAIQQYYAQFSAYPDRWDSLMDSSQTSLLTATMNGDGTLAAIGVWSSVADGQSLTAATADNEAGDLRG